MSVSLYYSATRTRPLSIAEESAIRRIIDDRNASFPYRDEEDLHVHEHTDGSDDLLSGSTKIPGEVDRIAPTIHHLLDSMTQLRHALPDADWRVHLDDLDIPWSDTTGYALADGGAAS